MDDYFSAVKKIKDASDKQADVLPNLFAIPQSNLAEPFYGTNFTGSSTLSRKGNVSQPVDEEAVN